MIRIASALFCLTSFTASPAGKGGGGLFNILTPSSAARLQRSAPSAARSGAARSEKRGSDARPGSAARAASNAASCEEG